MTNELSDFQKRIKAQTIVDNMQLDGELSNLKTYLKQLFADASPEVKDATSEEEVSQLIAEIKEGTSTNVKIARFLELAENLGLSV
tara:strand:- start:74 stop:331 length:258 start_codon:yes stop_codon:yes gene_type:complete